MKKDRRVEAEAAPVKFSSADEKKHARLNREIAGIVDSIERMTRARDAAQADIDQTQHLLDKLQAELDDLGA